MVELEIEQLNKTIARRDRVILSKDKQIDDQLQLLKEHDLCKKREEQILQEAAQVRKENSDLHGWVERETIRAVEQSMQISSLAS